MRISKAKNPQRCAGGFSNKSLTITYFHTGCSTIIGAKSFHGPVRDGKGWYRLAMVIRHNLYSACQPLLPTRAHNRNLEEVSCIARVGMRLCGRDAYQSWQTLHYLSCNLLRL